jgi:putative membrane protein
MILELALALIIGVLFGTITGLFPGIHINLVAAGLLALVGGAYFSGIKVIILVVFIVAMALTHTFIDFIPSIFLGAPEEDSFLAVLPGHELLKAGKGHEAVVLTLYGSLAALPIILIFTFLFIGFLDKIYTILSFLIPYTLILVSLYLIFREEEFIVSLVVFTLSGFLGLLTFNLPIKEPLLPLLTGLFGVSGLIVSLKNKITIPKQKITSLKEIKITKKSFFRGIIAASLSAPLASFLPGVGSGQAAVIGSELMGKEGESKKSFLFLVGAINTIVMALSFVTIYAIGRTRTGAAVAVSEILEKITLSSLIIIIITILLSGVLAFTIGIKLSKLFSKKINKISYRKISLIIITLLLIINLILSNALGILVLITGSSLGIFCILSRTRRINLMGALLIPTIVFYLF